MNSSIKTSLVRLIIITLILVIASAMALAAGGNSVTVEIGSAALPLTLVGAAWVFAVQWLAFVPAYVWQTERYYDLIGSISFISLIALLYVMAETDSIRALLMAAFVVIWAGRLGSFLFLRILQDGADSRFDEIKPQPLRFLVTWNMQGLCVILTTAPVLAVMSAQETQPLGGIETVGVLMWGMGFFIESIADWQKRRFKRSAQAQPFIHTGLWALSRHPNYFGEILLWAGIAVIALPALSGWQFVTLISPVFVFLLLTRVSGIPLLEAKADKKWADLPAYQEYKKKTPVLVPFLGKP